MADQNQNRWTTWPQQHRPDGSAGQRWRTSTRQDQTTSLYLSTSSGSRSREEHITSHEKENVRENQSGGSYWTWATTTTSARHWDWKSQLTSARSLTTRITSTRTDRSRERKTPNVEKTKIKMEEIFDGARKMERRGAYRRAHHCGEGGMGRCLLRERPSTYRGGNQYQSYRAGEFRRDSKGEVILRSGSENPQGSFVGAAKLSNNNAEMRAIIEALLFLLAQVEERNPIRAAREPVVIHSDSRYAVDIIRCGTRTRTNGLLRDFMVHLWEK